MKRFPVVALLALAAGTVPAEPEPTWLVGQWSGPLSVNKDLVLLKATTPEHRKLLEYAIERVQSAELMVLAYPSGRVEAVFDDGFRPHHRNWRGMWAVENGRSIMRFRGLVKGFSTESIVFEINPSSDGAYLPVVPGMPEGLSATLVRKRTTLAEPNWSPMKFKR
jgi:hypothetical protein